MTNDDGNSNQRSNAYSYKNIHSTIKDSNQTKNTTAYSQVKDEINDSYW